MENPNVWTPLHIEVSKNLDDHAKLVSVFKRYNYTTTEEEILSIVKDFYSDKRCGTSVVSTLVNKVSEK